MRAALVALKLTLDALELPTYTAFGALCSNGLYLSQTYALDLGYHFHVCHGHPASDRFRQDFAELTDALESGDRDHYHQQLIPSLGKRLTALCTQLEPPQTVSLTRTDWIALLADLAFFTQTHPLRSAQPSDQLHRGLASDTASAYRTLQRFSLQSSSSPRRPHATPPAVDR